VRTPENTKKQEKLTLSTLQMGLAITQIRNATNVNQKTNNIKKFFEEDKKIVKDVSFPRFMFNCSSPFWRKFCGSSGQITQRWVSSAMRKHADRSYSFSMRSHVQLSSQSDKTKRGAPAGVEQAQKRYRRRVLLQCLSA